MQFLLDQNISFRVSHSLKNDLPELVHVSDVGLLNATDEKIWLRFGNTTTSEMIEFIKKNVQTFKQFSLSDKFSEVGCLEFH